MRSQRRLRLYVVIVVVFLLALTYFTTDTGGGIQNHQFYKNTVNAMNNAHSAAVKKTSANEAKDRSHIQRLDIDNSNGGTRKQSSLNNDKPVVGSNNKIDDEINEISVAGRTKMPISKPKEDQVPIAGKKPESSAPATSKSVGVSEGELEHEHETDTPNPEDLHEKEASAELDLILKRSPVIIFSKTYCPYSKKAKAVFNQYSIVPAPYIVELDLHPLGPHLQNLLGKITGRRTVPNILVNGISIGGGDNVAALDKEDALVSKIKSIAGKNIMEIKRLPEAKIEQDGLKTNEQD